jgi:hypothetical protein
MSASALWLPSRTTRQPKHGSTRDLQLPPDPQPICFGFKPFTNDITVTCLSRNTSPVPPMSWQMIVLAVGIYPMLICFLTFPFNTHRTNHGAYATFGPSFFHR